MTEQLDNAALEARIHDEAFDGCLGSLDLEHPDTATAALAAVRTLAQVPISGFRVAAIAVGESGRCYAGTNLEFTGVPLNASLHAEQSAVINAWMHGESRLPALYVSEQPCGHCLQFLQELGNAAELSLHVGGAAHPLSDFFPVPFVLPSVRGSGLLSCAPRSVSDLHADDDATTQRAVNAAAHSYAPYSESPEGFVLTTLSGRHFAGRTVESAAFNPTVAPIISAFNQRNLSGAREEAIERAVHAKPATAVNHSVSLSEAILRGVSSVPLELRLLELA